LTEQWAGFPGAEVRQAESSRAAGARCAPARGPGAQQKKFVLADFVAARLVGSRNGDELPIFRLATPGGISFAPGMAWEVVF
jgi:hypothetical protein